MKAIALVAFPVFRKRTSFQGNVNFKSFRESEPINTQPAPTEKSSPFPIKLTPLTGY